MISNSKVFFTRTIDSAFKLVVSLASEYELHFGNKLMNSDSYAFQGRLESYINRNYLSSSEKNIILFYYLFYFYSVNHVFPHRGKNK